MARESTSAYFWNFSRSGASPVMYFSSSSPRRQSSICNTVTPAPMYTPRPSAIDQPRSDGL